MEPGSSVSRFRHYMGAVSGWQCSDGGEGMEPGSSVSRFRHYMGAVSGWQCRDEERGSLRVLPIVAYCVEWYSEVEWFTRGPPAVS